MQAGGNPAKLLAVNVYHVGDSLVCLIFQVYAATRPAIERLTHDLLKEYVNSIDAGTTELQIGVNALCFKLDKAAGTVLGNVEEAMVAN